MDNMIQKTLKAGQLFHIDGCPCWLEADAPVRINKTAIWAMFPETQKALGLHYVRDEKSENSATKSESPGSKPPALTK